MESECGAARLNGHDDAGTKVLLGMGRKGKCVDDVVGERRC